MDTKTLKTISFCSLFVFLVGAVGTIIAIIINAISFYIRSSNAKTYSYLVNSQLFANQYIPHYVLAGVIFGGIGLVLIYIWKHKTTN